MSWVRRHPLFYFLMISSGLLFFSVAWWLRTTVAAARDAQRDLRAARAEMQKWAVTQPLLTEASTDRLESSLLSLEPALDRLKAELTSSSELAVMLQAPQPAGRAEAYFDIASFVERMREHADRNGVQLNQDERFGFAGYAHAGPEQDELPIVIRDCRVIEYLLQSLFDAQPRQLLALRRERPRSGEPAPTPAHVISTGGFGPDFFEWEPRGSLRGPRWLETSAIRLSFIGQTVSLRVLLNRLATFELPLIVRAVEVEPAPVRPVEPKVEGLAATPITLLVPQTLSRFTVTVESIFLNTSPVAGER